MPCLKPGMVWRLLGVLGVGSILLAWASIIIAITVSRCFNILSMALSDLGDWMSACGGDPVCISMCNRLSEPIFNNGLIISGLILATASVGLYGTSRTYPLLIAVSGIALSLVGFLPERFGLYHFLSALVFFLTLPIAMIVYSMVNWRRGWFPRVALILAVLSFTGLILFVAIKLKIVVGLGYAVPEIIGALPASIWAGLVFYRHSVRC